MDSSLLSLFLPKGLLSHFEVTDVKELEHSQTKKPCFYIYLEEKNALPAGYDSSAYESKGFYEPATIQRELGIYLGINTLGFSGYT